MGNHGIQIQIRHKYSNVQYKCVDKVLIRLFENIFGRNKHLSNANIAILFNECPESVLSMI